MRRTRATSDDVDAFSLAAFECLDLDRDDAKVQRLRIELERFIAARARGGRPLASVKRIITALNARGHRFAPHPSDAGWNSWREQTNDGTRNCFIHVELDPVTVMVLYHETIDATVARRRARMSPEELAADKRIASFYERSAAIRADDAAAYAALSETDRMLWCLRDLEAGVNNGGFHTWLANTHGAFLADARKFLKKIGANERATILSDVRALLPSRLPRSRDALLTELDSAQKKLTALDARFDKSEESIALLTLDHLDSLRR
jgi:hypothetical protein